MRHRVWSAALVLAAMVPGPAGGDPLSGEEVQRRARGRLSGLHFTARVRMTLTLDTHREDRLLEVWRDDPDGQRERLMARFTSPPVLRGFALLYLENSDRPNDYFVYQPATERVRRISERTASQDIYGVDLEFVGFGVAQAVPSDVVESSMVWRDDQPVYRLVERPRVETRRFDERVSLVDPESFLILRTEHFLGGRAIMIATTERVEEVQGIPTPRVMRFERPPEHSEIRMEVIDVDYKEAIPSAFFSTLALIK